MGRLVRVLALPLALLLLLAGTALAAAAVPDQKPGAMQDETGKLSPQQVQALDAALRGLSHARFKAVLLPTLGADPDATLDAFWAAWQPGADAVLLLAGADAGRLRVQLGQSVSRGIDITALARQAYNPRAASGDLVGGLQALAEAIDAQLAAGGAPTVAPEPPAAPAPAPKPAAQPWHNPLASLDPRYWWLVAAIVMGGAAVALAVWAIASGRRPHRH